MNAGLWRRPGLLVVLTDVGLALDVCNFRVAVCVCVCVCVSPSVRGSSRCQCMSGPEKQRGPFQLAAGGWCTAEDRGASVPTAGAPAVSSSSCGTSVR